MKKLSIILTLILTLSLYGCGDQETTVNEVSTDSVVESDSSDIMDEQAKEQAPANDQIQDDSKEAENTDSDSNNQTETADSETVVNEETEEQAFQEYTVTAYDESQLMYAIDSVNVRKGPSTAFERIGELTYGQEVTVTGQADTNWYEIMYGDEKAYVSNKYLQNDKPSDDLLLVPQQEILQQTTPEIQPVTEVKNTAGVILVGDSRFVQMQESVGVNDCTWIAEESKGYTWFEEKAIPRIDGCVGNGSKILINLGVNDTKNIQKYITLVNAKAAEWTALGATVYYASVNPVWENPYVTEEQVEYFNTQMQSGLSPDVHWIDSHSYLTSVGYKLVDGLHYSSETYQVIYAYFMSCI